MSQDAVVCPVCLKAVVPKTNDALIDHVSKDHADPSQAIEHLDTAQVDSKGNVA